VESVLKALIQSILGYRVQMHNLSRLIRLSLLITDDLKNAFNLNTLEGAQYLTLLQNAYAQSRYNNNFDPDQLSVQKLFETVKHVYVVAEGIQRFFIELSQKESLTAQAVPAGG
jgi:HEPN domain-containing protein